MSPSGGNVVRFIRPELLNIGRYSAHRSPDTLEQGKRLVKLDANENPYGCSPGVPPALGSFNRYHIYPDAAQTRLRQRLQEYTGVDASSIVAANGSGELLDYILCLFLEPGDEVINCAPTFDMYRLRTQINRGKLVEVPRNEDFSVDIRKIKSVISEKTKLIILANPNNPTGNATPKEDILELADTGVPLLVDEAYYEFYGKTVASLVSLYPNLMVLRTFSKWTGLAGLRVGYGIFAPEIAEYLLTIKLPYNVNVAALVAVEQSFKEIDSLRGQIKVIISERERLYIKLKKLDFLRPFPSQANFIFCQVLKGQARQLQQGLLERRVLVRYFDRPGLQNAIRISVGMPEDTDILIEALREIGGK